MVTVFSIFFSMSGTSDVFRSPCKEIKKRKIHYNRSNLF